MGSGFDKIEVLLSSKMCSYFPPVTCQEIGRMSNSATWRCEKKSEFSACGKYRYRLERVRDGGRGTLLVVMVNPSTAGGVLEGSTEETWDRTLGRVMGFAIREDYQRFIIVNKFALISPDVTDLGDSDDPIGPLNNSHIEEAAKEADAVLYAWGGLDKLPPSLKTRYRDVDRIIRRCHQSPLSIGEPLPGGEPRHPLFAGSDLELVPWFERG